MNQNNQHVYAYGSYDIYYRLVLDERKTLQISVHPDSSVVVKAPVNTDMKSIEEKIRKRARWILKQKEYFHQFLPRTPEKYFSSGETHLYLGKQYRLKISNGIEESIKLKRGFFEIITEGKSNPQNIKELLDSWYQRKAEHYFSEIFYIIWNRLKPENAVMPALKIVP